MRYPSSEYDLSRLLLWTQSAVKPVFEGNRGLLALGLERVTNLEPSMPRLRQKWAFDFSGPLAPSGVEAAIHVIEELVGRREVRELTPAPRRFFDCAPRDCGGRQLAQRAWSAYPPTWHLDALGADLKPGTHPVAIGVLDSGADPAHPSLTGLVKSKVPLVDRAGHGTHVASTICGRAWGVPRPTLFSPDYELGYVPPGVLAEREIFVANIAKPRAVFEVDLVEYFLALDHVRSKAPQQILNLSFGGPRPLLMEWDTLSALSGSTLLVAAAGNDSPRVLYPAGYPECLSVGASSRETPNILAPFIPWNRNSDIVNSPQRVEEGLPAVDVYAPGRNIAGAEPVTTANALRPAGYRSGTSMATAYTTGVFGLGFSYGSGKTKLVDARAQIKKLSQLSNGGHHLVNVAAQGFFQ